MLLGIRFRRILGVQNINVSYMRATGLVMVGSAVSIILPGFLGKDGYKVACLMSDNSHCKSKVIVSVFLDRVFGLVGLVIGIVAGLLSLVITDGNFQMSVIWVTMCLTMAFVVAISITGILSLLIKLSYVQKCMRQYTDLPKSAMQFKFVFVNLLLSTIVHFMVATTFVFAVTCVSSTGFRLEDLQAGLFSIFANAFSITPSGLGISEAIVAKYYNILDFSQGGEIGFIARIFQYISYAMCGIIWLLIRLIFDNKSSKSVEGKLK
jgi:uncharacterized protein (TIRG00374 family)